MNLILNITFTEYAQVADSSTRFHSLSFRKYETVLSDGVHRNISHSTSWFILIFLLREDVDGDNSRIARLYMIYLITYTPLQSFNILKRILDFRRLFSVPFSFKVLDFCVRIVS